MWLKTTTKLTFINYLNQTAILLFMILAFNFLLKLINTIIIY